MPTAFCWSPCCTAAPPRKVWHHLIALCRAHSNMSMSFLYWVARNWILYSVCVSPVLSREEGSTSFNFWQHLLIQLRTQLAVSSTEANCWLISHLVSTRIYRSFSAPQQSASSTCSCMYGVILSQVRTLHFPAWNFYDSCLPVSPACPGPPEEQPILQADHFSQFDIVHYHAESVFCHPQLGQAL